MELSSIMASKLFRTSSRQGDILRKISSSGMTVGLEVQRPYQVHVPEKVESPQDNLSETPNDTRSVDTENVNKGDVSHGKQSSKAGSSSSVANVKSEGDEVVKSTGEQPDFGPESPNNDESKSAQSRDEGSSSEQDSKPEAPEELENSSRVDSKSSVTASIGTPLPTTDVTDHMDLEVADIKAMLNASELTFGVNRVRTKGENEVWVYYNDSVNLNDVMVPVIEQMNRPGYTYLEFNRLARSENAIVFVIIKDDTMRVKKPESEVTDKPEE